MQETSRFKTDLNKISNISGSRKSIIILLVISIAALGAAIYFIKFSNNFNEGLISKSIINVKEKTMEVEHFEEVRAEPSNDEVIANNNKVETIEDSSAEKSDSNKNIAPSTNTEKNNEKTKEKEKVEEDKKINSVVEAPEPPEVPDPIVID